MKLSFSLRMVLRVPILLLLMVTAVPLASASSSTEAKGKVGEAEKAADVARDAARREKRADEDWFKKQSEAFQNWQDADKKEAEARAAREKADQTGKEEDIKAAERAEKIAEAAREKEEKSDQARAAATEALNQAKTAKEQAKEKAAGTIAPAEEAVDDLPESSVKDKLKERIRKVKEDLGQLAFAPRAPAEEIVTETSGENVFARADLTKGQNVLGFSRSLKPSARAMQMKKDMQMNAEMPMDIHSEQPLAENHPMKDDSSAVSK